MMREEKRGRRVRRSLGELKEGHGGDRKGGRKGARERHERYRTQRREEEEQSGEEVELERRGEGQWDVEKTGKKGK